MPNATDVLCCAPDRHNPRLRCGYPLPCPHHTVVVAIEKNPPAQPAPSDPEPDRLIETLRRKILAAEAAFPELEPRTRFLRDIQAEIDHAYAKHGRDLWGRHEFFGILREEVDELWGAIKRDLPFEDLYPEMVQVAAMCLRYAETGDRYRGAHPVAKAR